MAEDPPQERLGAYYSLIVVGTEMALPVALGWWLDSNLGTYPWLIVIGVVAGFVLGITTILRVVNSAGTEDDGKDSSKPPPKDVES